jgi:hypothetical protein
MIRHISSRLGVGCCAAAKPLQHIKPKNSAAVSKAVPPGYRRNDLSEADPRLNKTSFMVYSLVIGRQVAWRLLGFRVGFQDKGIHIFVFSNFCTTVMEVTTVIIPIQNANFSINRWVNPWETSA